MEVCEKEEFVGVLSERKDEERILMEKKYGDCGGCNVGLKVVRE